MKDEITKDLETNAKPKKPRTEAQKAAFVKARQALAEKREKAKQEKMSNNVQKMRGKKLSQTRLKYVL